MLNVKFVNVNVDFSISNFGSFGNFDDNNNDSHLDFYCDLGCNLEFNFDLNCDPE